MNTRDRKSKARPFLTCALLVVSLTSCGDSESDTATAADPDTSALESTTTAPEEPTTTSEPAAEPTSTEEAGAPVDPPATGSLSTEEARSALEGVLEPLGAGGLLPFPPISPGLAPCIDEAEGQVQPGALTDDSGLGSIAVLRFESESAAQAALDLVASGEPSECTGSGIASNIETRILGTETADATVLLTYSVDDVNNDEEAENFQRGYYLSGDLVIAVDVTEVSGNRDAVLTIAREVFPPTA